TDRLIEQTGKAVTLTLALQPDVVSCLALSADGTHLFGGTLDIHGGVMRSTIKVWDVKTGKETFAFRGHSKGGGSLGVSGGGKRLFSAGADHAVKVWDLDGRTDGREPSGANVTLRGHTGAVNSLAPSADGQRLFSASRDNTIKAWDLRTAKQALTL